MKMTDSQKEIYRLNKFPMKISTIWYKEIKNSNSKIDIGPKKFLNSKCSLKSNKKSSSSICSECTTECLTYER